MFGEWGGGMGCAVLIEMHAMLQIGSCVFHPKLMECPFPPLHLTECPTKCGEGLTPRSRSLKRWHFALEVAKCLPFKASGMSGPLWVTWIRLPPRPIHTVGLQPSDILPPPPSLRSAKEGKMTWQVTLHNHISCFLYTSRWKKLAFTFSFWWGV